MKFIVMLLTVASITVSAQNLSNPPKEKKEKGKFMQKMEKWGIISLNPGRAGEVIASSSHESSHKYETKVISRGYGWQEQFAPGASSLSPKPRSSTFVLDTGRTYIHKEKGGDVGYYEGYDGYTGEPVIVTYSTEYKTEVKEKRAPYHIPYNSLPDRSQGQSQFVQGGTGFIELKPIITSTPFPSVSMPRR